jgi:hypothetical protein
LAGGQAIQHPPRIRGRQRRSQRQRGVIGPRPAASGQQERKRTMFTSIDKALVALIMSLLYLLNTFFGVSLGLNETQVATIISLLTPILVWAIPNKTVR